MTIKLRKIMMIRVNQILKLCLIKTLICHKQSNKANFLLNKAKTLVKIFKILIQI